MFMSTRDNLALCAMQVLLKKGDYEHVSFWQRIRRLFGFSFCISSSIDPFDLAVNAYEIADAMIAVSQAPQKYTQE